MNQIDLSTEPCQINGIFHRHVSAAYHCHIPPSEKSAVAGSTVGNPFAPVLILPWNVQHGMFCPRSQDQGLRLIGCSVRCLHRLTLSMVDHRRHLCGLTRYTHGIRMLLEFHPHIKSIHAGHPQVVVHFIGIQNLAAAHGLSLQYKQVQSCTDPVYRRR